MDTRLFSLRIVCFYLPYLESSNQQFGNTLSSLEQGLNTTKNSKRRTSILGNSKVFFRKTGLILRLFFVFLRGALAVLLLADINFETTQHPVYQFPITRSGLSPLNTSLINTDQFNITATAQFWWYFPAILSDSLAVQPVTPLNCTGDQCKSFFFPGSMRNILLDPKLPPIGSNEYPGANSYMQNDAPGYQIDYAPLDPSDPTFSPTDCQVFGIDMMAIQICLKTTQSSLLAGTCFVVVVNSRLECLS